MTFLIILAVLVVIIVLLMRISATITVIYDEKWAVKMKVLWFEFAIKLTPILQKLLFSGKDKETKKTQPNKGEAAKKNKNAQGGKAQKPNYFKKLWDEEGIVGILSLLTNIYESASSAVKILIRGFHIYSLYVKIIVGTSDAALTALQYGKICGWYYPVKGIITTNFKVDNYDEVLMPDFIAEHNEYEFQLIASLTLGTILKCVCAAAFEFLKNTMKNG